MLKQVQDIQGNTEAAGTNGKSILEALPDLNKLKPAVWAEHKKKKECFGVSLGVRSYVRSLYLYRKLSQLRKMKDQDIALQNVHAHRHKKKGKGKATKYKKPKPPCPSCKIVFDPSTFNSKDAEKPPEKVPFFGNCAEYDVIRTGKLDSCLVSIANSLWNDVELACIKQFSAFTELTRKLDEPNNTSRNDILQTYHTKTHEAKTKVLRYEWDRNVMNTAEPNIMNTAKLVTVVWPLQE